MVRPRGRREAPGETLDDAEGVIQTVVADREFAECYTGLVRTVMQFSLVAVMQWSVGEWLSLVEHLVRDQGVGGSNPLSPTNLFKRLSRIQSSVFSCNRVQLAISVPQWACGNRVPPVPP